VKISRFNKAIISGVSTVVNVLVAVAADDVVDMNEGTHIVTTVVTVALGIYAVWKVRNSKEVTDGMDSRP
jgi:hypothetical protein